MKIYRWKEHEKTLQLAALDENILSTHPIGTDFYGESKIVMWTPIEVNTLYKKKFNDFPRYLSGQPVVSRKVKDIIEPFVTNEVEFLPLLHEHQELYMINVVNVLDCVDWNRSDVKRFDNGSFSGFNKLVFDFNKIPEHTYMFKFKEWAAVAVFVTEAFKNLIEANKLKGLDFSIVFDSEFTEEKELEQKRKFEEALSAIEANKGFEFSYEEAIERVNKNQAVASGKWKMQRNKKGQLCLGELLQDLTWQWMIPVFIPPVLLDYQWHEVDKEEI